MPRKKLHKFEVELQQDYAENIKEILSKDTVELHDYTYKIKTREITDNKSRYVLSPVALSAGYRNCFTPIVTIEISEAEGKFTAAVTLKAFLAVRIMLLIFCIGAALIETALLIYLLYCMIIYRSMFTLEVFKPFVSFLIIPSAMVIAYYVTFRNVKNAILSL